MIPHYALSRLTATNGSVPKDPKAFRVYNADTLEQLHGVWIEIGDAGDSSRLSAFIP